MFNHYIRVAGRNLLKYKSLSFINITGLAIGMTCTTLILLYVQHEISYDRFYRDADNIYRIAWISATPQTRTPHPMAQAMVRDFPQVLNAVSLSPIWGPGLTRPKLTVQYRDKQFDEPGFFQADSTFFDVFTFRLLEGDKANALKQPGGIVITEEIARKYFGDENALGKTLTLRVGSDYPLTVTGVMENIPAASHFHFDFLISYVTLKPLTDGEFYTWADFGHYNYLRFADGADVKEVEAQMMQWAAGYLGWNRERLASLQARFELQPITDIHLKSNLKWELEPNSDMAYVYLFGSSAVLILLLACINFMNILTARADSRAREVALRKVMGSFRFQLVRQFLGESLVLSGLASLLTIALVELLLPWFNNLTGKSLNLSLLNNLPVMIGIFLVAVAVGVVSGSYPAFILSAFKPASVLKGTLHDKIQGVAFRRILVLAQFVISIALLIATGIVSAQLDFLRNRQLGFDKEQIVVVPIKNPAMRQSTEAIKNELLKNAGIASATAVSNVPGSRFNQNPVRWAGADENRSMSEIRVDFDFFETLNIAIIAGRHFSKDHATDRGQTFMLNETAASLFDWESAVGEQIIWDDDEIERTGTVIGVAADFNFQSLHRSIEPIIFQVLPEEFNYMLVKIQPEGMAETLDFLERQWQKFDPQHSFEFSFLDEDLDKLYQSEDQMHTIFEYFTALAIFIACLGLYSLIAFSAQKRFKEIGIRKALGASSATIVRLLSKEYLKLVVLANVFAWPAAYLVMFPWLQSSAYQTNFNPAIFFVSGFLVLVIALATVAFQAAKAAATNPVDALRAE